MSELIDATELPASPEERANDRVVLAVLVIDALLLAVLELMNVGFTLGAAPVPVSGVVALVTTPLLVVAAGRLSVGRLGTSAPFLVWIATLCVLGFTGPGGDVLLPIYVPLVQWANLSVLLLVVLGLVPTAFVLGRVLRAKGFAVR
jgi:hypothetical protein